MIWYYGVVLSGQSMEIGMWNRVVFVNRYIVMNIIVLKIKSKYKYQTL